MISLKNERFLILTPHYNFCIVQCLKKKVLVWLQEWKIHSHFFWELEWEASFPGNGWEAEFLLTPSLVGLGPCLGQTHGCHKFKVWVKRFSEDPIPIQMERKSSSHISRSSIHSYLPQSIHLDPLLLVAPFATQILWCNSMHTIRQVIEQWVNATKCRGCNPLGCIEIHYSPLFPPGCSSMAPVILSPASTPIHTLLTMYNV